MSRVASTEGWVGIGAYVPPEVKRELVELSREKRTSVSEEIRSAITAWMERHRWHGTVGGYTNHGCRCDLCRKAQREYQREYTRRRTATEGTWRWQEYPRPEGAN